MPKCRLLVPLNRERKIEAPYRSIFLCNMSRNFYTRNIAPATRKTATEEDRGEDNKDPDWLIEQSIGETSCTVGVYHTQHWKSR